MPSPSSVSEGTPPAPASGFHTSWVPQGESTDENPDNHLKWLISPVSLSLKWFKPLAQGQEQLCPTSASPSEVLMEMPGQSSALPPNLHTAPSPTSLHQHVTAISQH